jgi:hypothetical protein
VLAELTDRGRLSFEGEITLQQLRSGEATTYSYSNRIVQEEVGWIRSFVLVRVFLSFTVRVVFDVLREGIYEVVKLLGLSGFETQV